jgi:hypothetical protein
MTAGPFLHIARDDTGVDVEAAERAAADFLSALGIDVDHEDLRDTPGRMARRRPGSSPASAATWTGASSSRSGWPAAACWPA